MRGIQTSSDVSVRDGNERSTRYTVLARQMGCTVVSRQCGYMLIWYETSNERSEQRYAVYVPDGVFFAGYTWHSSTSESNPSAASWERLRFENDILRVRVFTASVLPVRLRRYRVSSFPQALTALRDLRRCPPYSYVRT